MKNRDNYADPCVARAQFRQSGGGGRHSLPADGRWAKGASRFSILGNVALGVAVGCFIALLIALPAAAAPDISQGFDDQGEKIFNRLNETPLPALTGLDSTRNLNSYYELRQYPGSPPRIPHEVPDFFRDDTADCLACHGKGGYAAELDAFAPVSPHPEMTSCSQCHVVRRTEELFVESDWRALNPPRLGNSQLAGSPPTIPHSLQLREDCLACHAGPGAVAEIRVEHAARGNCRQCHGVMISTEPGQFFTRNPIPGK
jgi:nitrate reductase (cytochrome), electron transfer subunit